MIDFGTYDLLEYVELGASCLGIGFAFTMLIVFIAWAVYITFKFFKEIIN